MVRVASYNHSQQETPNKVQKSELSGHDIQQGQMLTISRQKNVNLQVYQGFYCSAHNATICGLIVWLGTHQIMTN